MGLDPVGLTIGEEQILDGDLAGDLVQVDAIAIEIEAQAILLNGPAAGDEAIVESEICAGGLGRLDGSFETLAGEGQGLADGDGHIRSVGNGAETEAGGQAGCELAGEKAELEGWQ